MIELLNEIAELLQHPVAMIIWIHFLADVILQTDTMAKGKSSSNKWLGLHVLVYSIPWLYFGWLFVIITAVSHFVTDYISSRVATNLCLTKVKYTTSL